MLDEGGALVDGRGGRVQLSSVVLEAAVLALGIGASHITLGFLRFFFASRQSELSLQPKRVLLLFLYMQQDLEL